MARIGRLALGVSGAALATIGGLLAFTGLNARHAENRVPRDGDLIDVPGARLHYVDMGSGPPIVMVHGLGGQIRNFTYALAERLARDYRLVIVDRPGSGYSVATPGFAQGLHAQAALIGRFIRALGLEKPLLVGHSLGGALSLALALDEPGTIRGLALVAPLTQPLEVVPAAFKALMIPSPRMRRAIAWTLAAPMGRITAARSRTALFGPDRAPDDFEDRGGGALTLRPSAFFAASSEVAHGTDELVGMAARYPTIAMPVGILYGRGDGILSPELHGARTAMAIPGAELELIDGGHMIPLSAPDLVADWVRRQAARS